MSKKSEKIDWENKDKKGMITKGHTKANNELIRMIICDCDMQTCTLYLILLSHRNATTNKCFPSIETLARECGVTDRTIKTMIKRLADNGYIIIDSGKQGISNTYYFPKESFYNGEGVCAVRGKKGNFANSPKHEFEKNKSEEYLL